MKILLTLFLFFITIPCLADGYSIGTVIDGYTKKSDGFWWRDSLAYTLQRTKVYRGNYYGYNSCNYYYRNKWVPQAVIYKEKVIEKEKPVYKELEKVSYTDKDWREKILDIAEKRDEQKAFLEAINALGFTELQQTQKTNTNNPYAYRLNQSKYTYADQGNTIYGYSLGSLSNLYGDNDVSLWMQQYARGQQHAQEVAEKGLGGMLQAIELEGSNRARVATILAKAQLLKSLDTPETVTKTQVEVSGTTNNPPQFQAQNTQANLQALFQAKCYQCHSGNKIDGDVDLTQWNQFTPQQKKKVWDQISSGKMPKGGDPLSFTEMQIVMDALAKSLQP